MHTDFLLATPPHLHHPYAVYRPGILAIQDLGHMQGPNALFDCPQRHFPPRCTCSVGCWRLVGGRVEEDVEGREVGWGVLEGVESDEMGKEKVVGREEGELRWDGVLRSRGGCEVSEV